jgi:hypothetical protein
MVDHRDESGREGHRRNQEGEPGDEEDCSSRHREPILLSDQRLPNVVANVELVR